MLEIEARLVTGQINGLLLSYIPTLLHRILNLLLSLQPQGSMGSPHLMLPVALPPPTPYGFQDYAKS